MELTFVKATTDGDAITLCYESSAGRVEVNFWIGPHLAPYIAQAAKQAGRMLKRGPMLLMVEPGLTWTPGEE